MGEALISVSHIMSRKYRSKQLLLILILSLGHLAYYHYFFFYRNMSGLMKALMKLLQMQALREGQSGEKDIRGIYSIRYVFATIGLCYLISIKNYI